MKKIVFITVLILVLFVAMVWISGDKNHVPQITQPNVVSFDGTESIPKKTKDLRKEKNKQSKDADNLILISGNSETESTNTLGSLFTFALH